MQNFYNHINRKEMYIRYVNKLCELHLECDNFTEAAYTLRLHSKLLMWSNSEISFMLKSSRYPNYLTHRELKEKIYYEMIDYFDKGKVNYIFYLYLSVLIYFMNSDVGVCTGGVQRTGAAVREGDFRLHPVERVAQKNGHLLQ